MSETFAYYPGCSLHVTAKEYDMSVKAVCERMGITLQELEDWVCCGATPVHAVNPKLSLALSAKNLSVAKGTGKELAVACAACFNRLKVTDSHLSHDPALRDQINALAETDYSGGVAIKHVITILNDLDPERLQQAVTKKLEGLKVACYYGCLLVRPPKIMEFDDAENPTVMEKVLACTGAEMVDWNFKTECCGASLSVPEPGVVLKLVRDILADAKSRGADVIAVACPLCQMNLDMRQHEVEKKYSVSYGIPIMYFTQLMGLAMGLPAQSLGFKKLFVSPDKVLSEKNLL